MYKAFLGASKNYRYFRQILLSYQTRFAIAGSPIDERGKPLVHHSWKGKWCRSKPHTTMTVVLTSALPGDLGTKLQGLSHDNPEQYELIRDLILHLGQEHLFKDWRNQAVLPSTIRDFAAHLEEVDKACPAGLRDYIKTAQQLLKGKIYGVNPGCMCCFRLVESSYVNVYFRQTRKKA